MVLFMKTTTNKKENELTPNAARTHARRTHHSLGWKETSTVLFPCTYLSLVRYIAVRDKLSNCVHVHVYMYLYCSQCVLSYDI